MDPNFIRELFAQFRPVTVKRMFGGVGIMVDGMMIGLVMRDLIYLKADTINIPEFEREGSGPFTYTRGRKSGSPSEHALPYWRLPERLYDDPDELAVWAARALETAQRRRAPRHRQARPRRVDSSKRPGKKSGK